MLMNTGGEAVDSKNKLLTTVAWDIGGRREYALEGGVFVGGAVVSWLRDGLGIIKTSADVAKLATSVPDSGGVYFVPAFAGLGAPIGILTRAVRFSESHAARPRPTSPGRRSKVSHCKLPI